MKWGSYFRLMRFDKPAGTLLLWFPTAWALWIANQGNPTLRLGLLFLVGTILMRAAGCVMNDIADRHIDLHVQRTAKRPLTTGEVGLQEAIILLLVLLFAALLILIQLPKACFYYALFAVLITVVYPFCKRFIQGPQLVLGLAFSMGIPMAYAASGRLPDLSMFILLIINFLWILAYDTQYAMVDRKDDLRIGVKSTAILFASYDRVIIAIIQFVFHSLWLLLAFEQGYSRIFLFFWLLATVILLHQQRLILKLDPLRCFQAFLTNSYYGLLMWIALIFSY